MMSLNAIEEIYYNFEKLNGNYKESPEAEKSYEEVMDYIRKKGVFGKAGTSRSELEFEDLVIKHACENEKQGFVYGFQYAIQLMTSAKVVPVE